MAYVGADAQQLDALRGVTGVAADGLGVTRRRIADLLAEAGEGDCVGASLASVEGELRAAGCEIGAAASTAAADAQGGGQTGWRASLGMVDDMALDVLFVNDVHRLIAGRDLNTGQPVGAGGRLASGIFLIPFAKLAKAGKLLKFADDAAGVAAGAAARTVGRGAVTNADEVVAVLGTLQRGRSGSSRIRVVDSMPELDELFDDLARHGRPTTRGPWPAYALDDGTAVARRGRSTSGGPTLDIFLPDSRRWKVHVDPWPPQ